MPQVEVIFLGTGGGRFVTITQKRRTAGLRILGQKSNIHLDPGPGALVHSINMGLDPQKIDTLLISHSHPDHYTDAEVLIEAMTRGITKKRGVLVAPRSVLHGNEVCEQSVSSYHQRMLSQVIKAEAGAIFELGEFKVHVTEARHTDPDTVGYRFKTFDVGDFAYTSDTQFFEELGKYYEGVRLLLMCVMRPHGKPWKGHMTTDDAIKILEEVKPEMAVLTHLGMQMIFQGPLNEAKLIEKETGVPTIAALDEMRILINEKISIIYPKKQVELNKFL
jgi:phosphoribosyl 1,2-cyclic phosphodiesterase